MTLSLIIRSLRLTVRYNDGVYSVGKERFTDRRKLTTWILHFSENVHPKRYNNYVVALSDKEFTMGLHCVKDRLCEIVNVFAELQTMLKRDGSTLSELCLASLETRYVEIDRRLLPERLIDRKMELRIANEIYEGGRGVFLEITVRHEHAYILIYKVYEREYKLVFDDPAELAKKIEKMSWGCIRSVVLFVNKKRDVRVGFTSFAIDSFYRGEGSTFHHLKGTIVNSSIIEALRLFTFSDN